MKKKVYTYRNMSYNKSLKVIDIPYGTILPLKNKKGGVLNQDNKFISLSYHDGEWFKLGGKYEEEKVQYINENVVFLGVFIHQWGHFILDSLSRSWIVAHLKNIKEYKFAFLSESHTKIEGNYLEALELLGIKASQIMVINEAKKFKKVIVPQMSTYADHGFNKEYPKIFRRMVKNASIDDISVPDKIYLTRAGLKIAQKKEFGEKIIEKNFERNGYTVMRPEKLTVKEQIAVFQKAKEIVCLNGSIPFDIVFGSSILRLIIINKTSLLHINMLELSEVSGITPIYLNSYYEPFRNFPRTLGEGPFLLKFGNDLKLYFKKNNLKYTVPLKYPSNFVLLKYTLLCLKNFSKSSLKYILRKSNIL